MAMKCVFQLLEGLADNYFCLWVCRGFFDERRDDSKCEDFKRRLINICTLIIEYEKFMLYDYTIFDK